MTDTAISKVRSDVAQNVLDVTMGIREGVGRCRTAEFTDWISNLIRAKQAKIDIATLPMPLLADHVEQSVEGAVASKASINVDGGIEWTFIKIGGSYGTSTAYTLKIKVDMAFTSLGAPDLNMIAALSVDDLTKLKDLLSAQ